MKNLVYFLDKPGGDFRAAEETLPAPAPGELLVKTLRTAICQSDVVIYSQGLARIKSWPAVILHEASCRVEAVGEGVTRFAPGDLIGLGCDIPCSDLSCIYCGEHGTGDWTSCPNTQATGHEFPGFARSHALLPAWFVSLGPVVKFDPDISPDQACHLEPLACCLEGLTRVNSCIEKRVVVLIGSGSQSTYALQCALAMGARKVILVNRGAERLERVLRDFADPRLTGLRWDGDVAAKVFSACKPFNEPHFVMVTAPCASAYALATQLMGYGTVLDGHAGVKGAGGKPRIEHTVDLNNDIHYKLQCYQATHGSGMRGINRARELINGRKLPLLARMTQASERFHHSQLKQAIERSADADSLKVIVNWE